MNVSDSELVTSILSANGYTIASSIDTADIIIFNTCSVRQHAEMRVLGRISNEVSRKMLNPELIIGVIGCMAQRMGEKLIGINDKIDFVVGVENYRLLPRILGKIPALSGHHPVKISDEFSALTAMSHKEIYDDVNPVRKNDLNAFVTIMRGCDNFCSYCIVPYVRGRERSRPADSVLKEVDIAGREGYKDVTLLGQNVNSYKYEDIGFPKLLSLVNQIESIERVRFITSHPKDISDELINVMADCSKVCNHIHLPMQSGDNQILQQMNREYTIEHYTNIIQKLREHVPDIAITTDIMVGFPGETNEQFLNTVKAMEDIRFDYSFMFKYSARDGTKAAQLADNVEEQIKLARLDMIIKLQNSITHEKYVNQIGRIVEVYVEKLSKKSDLEVSGKSEDFKIVVFPGDESLVGSFVKVKITDAAGWTLRGKMI